MSTASHYQCPLCKCPLSLSNKNFNCKNNHSFDVSKEGYVNLLPVQFKQSKNPGDNKSMVNARRDFLEKGYYQPLATRLRELIGTHAPNANVLLDAGCGEGYYTHQFAPKAQVYGVDIAKEAIKKAAKKYTKCHFSVATLSQLPFSDLLFDAIISIYAPILETEFNRVLNDKGILITVTPAKNHLFELKALIYQEALTHDEDKSPIEHLTLLTQEHLSYPMQLDNGQDALNLLSMTPFAFKATEQAKENIAQKGEFVCQADFIIRVFSKD